MKINVDAASILTHSSGPPGFVARDHNGLLIRGQAIFYEQTTITLVMEAHAIRDEVQLSLKKTTKTLR
jgi:hypothetical protein